MATKTTRKTAPAKKQTRAAAAKKSGGAAKKGAGGRAAAARRLAARNNFRTDHTPPPLVVRGGSLIVETDEPFVGRDNNGNPGHTRRHRLSDREILGVRILSVAGASLYDDDHAQGTSIKIWFNRNVRTEQVFIGGGAFHVESDFDLGTGVSIRQPPNSATVQRVREYSHPRAGGRGIERVEVVKAGQTLVFPKQDGDPGVWMVLIWDTTHDHA